MVARLLTLVVALLLPVSAALAADTDRPAGLCDATAFSCLAGAVESLDLLDGADSPLERGILIRTAIDNLAVLHQLFGCHWAGVRLAELYALPECPQMAVGYSIDGRIRLQLERMDLFNPAYSRHTMFLVTLESQSALELTAESAGRLEFETPTGELVSADILDASHPLQERLAGSAGSYAPADVMPPGVAWSFRQVFSLKQADIRSFKAVSLDWGGYRIRVPLQGDLELEHAE